MKYNIQKHGSEATQQSTDLSLSQALYTNGRYAARLAGVEHTYFGGQITVQVAQPAHAQALESFRCVPNS